MGKPDLYIETAFLATKDKLVDRVMLCNRIEANDTSGDFLFYLIEVLSPNQGALIKKIVQIISNNAKTTIGLSLESFEKTLAQVNETLERLTGVENKAWIGKMNAVIGLVQEDEIFLSQTGNIVGYIFRKNKISSLTEQSEDPETHPGRTFTEIISGGISVGDQVVFSNAELFSHISIDRLRTLVKIDDVRAEILELKHYLQKSHSVDSNIVLIEAKNEKNENDLDEMLFLDEAEETTFSNFKKELLPKLKKIQVKALEYWEKITKKTKELHRSAKAGWNEKYGPKTKQVWKSSSKKIQEGLKIGQEKFTEIRSSEKGSSSFKIKTNKYKKNGQDKFGIVFDNTITWFKKIDFFSERNRRILIVVFVAIILMVGYTKIKNNNTQKAETTKQVEINAAYDKAKSAYDAAQKDKTTDLNRYYAALALAETAKKNNSNIDKAISLIDQINSILDDKTKTVRIKTDTSFTLANNTKNIALVGSVIYGVSTDGKIYSADVREKSPKLVGSTGSENGNIISMVYSTATNSIFMNTDTKKLLSLDLTSNVIGKLTTADPNSDWKMANSFAVYSTNIYALDTNYAGIWKYTHTDTTNYSKASAYIDIKKTSLLTAVDIAIDGNIYILKTDGTLTKLVRGAVEPDFALKDIPGPKNKIDQPAKIFTSEDTNSIFVLDKGNNRIIKFDKSGEFTNQYAFDGITIENFVVNAKLQKIWAISNGKIYEGNL